YNGGGDTSEVLKITVHYADGEKESIVCRNGTEFADYIHRIDVPGSKWVDVLSDNHQMRYFVKALTRTAPIEKVVLESFGASAAPTLVAMTAELADANAKPLPAANAHAQLRVRLMSYDVNPKNPKDITVQLNLIDERNRTLFL